MPSRGGQPYSFGDEVDHQMISDLKPFRNEWKYERNARLGSPSRIPVSCKSHAWFRCPNGHQFRAKPVNGVTHGCGACLTQRVTGSYTSVRCSQEEQNKVLVLLVGCTGSGKETLGRAIAAGLGSTAAYIPVMHTFGLHAASVRDAITDPSVKVIISGMHHMTRGDRNATRALAPGLKTLVVIIDDCISFSLCVRRASAARRITRESAENIIADECRRRCDIVGSEVAEYSGVLRMTQLKTAQTELNAQKVVARIQALLGA